MLGLRSHPRGSMEAELVSTEFKISIIPSFRLSPELGNIPPLII